jgi:hypothetical protein
VEVVAVHGLAKLEFGESETQGGLVEMLSLWVLAEGVVEGLADDVVEAAEGLLIARGDSH